MGVEIERKFLLANDEWRKKAGQGLRIQQGYLNSHIERNVRVRTKGNKAFLTIKGKTVSATRLEFEYEIPFEEARQLLALCEKPIIDKIRYELLENGDLWEIDEFEGDNTGLIVAEIELQKETQTINFPKWIGKEVTHEVKYYNVNLIKVPFKLW